MIDHKSKVIDHEQIDGLRLLADQVIHMLEQENLLLDYPVSIELSDDSQKSSEGRCFSAKRILFADFVGFTNVVENSDPGELLEILNIFFNSFDRITAKHNVLR